MELEPLRRLGWDLSQARLKQEALNLGIEKSITDMTQAEKSQLRYIAILSQVTTAQGDMARTLNAPANQLRILSAQATQAARALGNIFIPALNAILPYAIAFLQVVRKIANEVANLFGFTMPEIDYSGIGNLASGAGDAEDALGEAAQNAKKLKNAVTGIDELNILSENDTDNALGGLSDIFADIKLPEYDFLGDALENRANEIAEKMEGPFRTVLDIAKNIAIAIGAWKIIAWVNKTWKVIKNTWTAFKGLKVVSAFLDGFSLIKATGGNVIQSLVGGLDNVRANLTGVQKGFIVAAAAIAGFVGTKNVVRDIALDIGNIGANLLKLSGIAVGVEIAMYTALGPPGLILGALTLLTGALAGVQAAEQKILDDMNAEIMYGNKGVLISDLADAYGTFTQKIIDSNQPIVDNQKVIDNAQESVKTAKGNIDSISEAIKLGAYTAKEKLPKIKEEFDKLKTDTETILKGTYENIVWALAGSVGAVLEANGENVPAMIEMLRDGFKDVTGRYESLTESQIKLDEQFDNGKISSEKYHEELQKLTDELLKISGINLDVKSAFTNLESTMSSIDWEKESERNNFFKNMEKDASAAQESIGKNFEAVKESLERARAWSNEPAWQNLISKALIGNEQSLESQTAALKIETNRIFDIVQSDLIGKMEKVEKEAATKWGNMNWFQKKWAGSKEEFIHTALEDFKKDYADPISEKINTTFKNLEMEGSAWANTTMKGIINSLFDVKNLGEGHMVTEYKSSLSKEITKAFNVMGEDTLKGYNSGITDKKLLERIGISGAQTFEEYKNGLHNSGDFGSPSKVTKKYGVWAVEGFTNGVTSQINAAVDPFTSLFNKILTKLDTFALRFRNGINDLLSNMTFSMNGITVNAGGQLQFTNMPKLNIPKLAQGGVIPPRRNFLVEYGDQRIGNNIESPESLLRQIVNEESGAGSEELLEKAVALLQEIADKPTEVSLQVDKREIARASNSGNHALGYTTRT